MIYGVHLCGVEAQARPPFFGPPFLVLCLVLYLALYLALYLPPPAQNKLQKAVIPCVHLRGVDARQFRTAIYT